MFACYLGLNNQEYNSWDYFDGVRFELRYISGRPLIPRLTVGLTNAGKSAFRGTLYVRQTTGANAGNLVRLAHLGCSSMHAVRDECALPMCSGDRSAEFLVTQKSMDELDVLAEWIESDEVPEQDPQGDASVLL